MEIRFQCHGPDKWKADVMLVPCPRGERPSGVAPLVDAAAPWLAVAPAARDFKGDKGELLLLHGHPDLGIPRVLAVGMGSKDDVDMDGVRGAMAGALRHCRKLGLESALLPMPLPDFLPGGRERLLEEAVCAALLGTYRVDGRKRADPDEPSGPQWLAVGFEGEFTPDGDQAAARRGERAAEAVMLARNLANTPANLLGPDDLAREAERRAAEAGLKCEILDEKALEAEGMNCLLAVGRGSARPPRLVVLEHAPAGHEQEKPLILAGKGVMFDSGGISIKPAAGMHAMKADMTGAAAVLATLLALAGDQVRRRVIGILACAENMPDGAATRPGDVVIAANGDSVEIQNTDAEGRLALCDALAYAQKRWTPAAVVDIATLTGACAVALGDQVAGLFCDDDDLRERLLAAGRTCGEPFWPLPLWKPYAEKLKSEVADICHMGPREGGAINAALFLKHFIREGTRWAHLDVAGTDWSDKAAGALSKGATAFGTRALLELARGGV